VLYPDVTVSVIIWIDAHLTQRNGIVSKGRKAKRKAATNDTKTEQHRQTRNGPLEVHLSTRYAVSRDNKRWAFALNEPDAPMVGESRSAKDLHEIIDWLDVEDSVRYKPTRNTYCNIYAYDFCYLAGAYLPRVWWKKRAVKSIIAGEVIEPAYGTNVTEMNANAIHDWFEDYGPDFSWRQTEDLTELQNAANDGHVGVIVAKRKRESRSGHITAIAPETDEFEADRRGGEVYIPVESQAGSRNYEYITKGHRWWLKDKFSSFGLWIHEL